MKGGEFGMKEFKLLLSLVLCLLFLVFSSSIAFSAEFDELEVGDTAPDFTLKDLAEKEHTLSALDGKVAVIQFGSSTTIPYLEEVMPMNKVIKTYRKKVVFYTVYTKEQKYDWQASDYFEKYERAKGLRFQYGVQSGKRMSSKILVDDVDEAVFTAYGSVPAGIFIVDADGNLAYKAKMVKANNVEKALKKLKIK
jgi:peroxiredoxin